ncbi:MAG: hypothetical protein GX811_12225, partial [Lentisphaerae bacterium]|nr:hypothetical protein [Lentisphaerota bacterium]
AANLKKTLLKHLKELQKMTPSELMQHRYDKFRKMGVSTTRVLRQINGEDPEAEDSTETEQTEDNS